MFFPSGKPEPLVYHIPQEFFNALQHRLSLGSKKRRLPNFTTGGTTKPELLVFVLHQHYILQYSHFLLLLYFYSTIFQWGILYFLLHCIYFTAIITLQIEILHTKTYDKLITYDVLLRIKPVAPNLFAL